jgi:hypothetical protein
VAASHFRAMIEHLATRLAACGIHCTRTEQERHL